MTPSLLIRGGPEAQIDGGRDRKRDRRSRYGIRDGGLGDGGQASAQASWTAWQVPGVKSVKNDLAVKEKGQAL
ncbi:MAG: hypothetical protein ACT4OL_10945 [Nitrospiraceae bacterium]